MLRRNKRLAACIYMSTIESDEVCCPICGNQRVWRDGLRYTKDGEVQRYICRDCGYRFSQPKPLQNTSRSSLNSSIALTLDRQISVTQPKGTKNLAKVESRIRKQAAGATKLSKAELKGKLVEFLWWMKKEGYAESTITRRVRRLKTMTNLDANLLDPESVKLTIAKQEKWSPTMKEHAVVAYTCYLKMQGKTWEPPKYRRISKLPFIPTETEVDQLIASCNKKVATFLQLLKETGMRSGEAWELEWIDFNFENRTVRVTPEKGGNPRVVKISNKLIAMLNALPKDHQGPFKGSLRHFARTFRRQRKKATHKLQNKRIKKITFHTLRHWKATMEYHRTKDILHVKQMLGHKSIQSTLIYTHLVNFEDDQFTCRVARTLKEAEDLIEAGFDYVTDMDDAKLFRKRK
jgi:integrase